MKNKISLCLALIFTAVCIAGCFSTPKKYFFSFAEDGEETVKITFMNVDKTGVRLVDCNDVQITEAEKGKSWEAAKVFPAGKPLNIRVYVYWKEDIYGERRRGIFKCPPLESGKEYKLWFNGSLKGGSLLLTDTKVSEIKYSFGKPMFKLLHEQIIPPLP